MKRRLAQVGDRNESSAFTMIELLVVVAIIALLGAISFSVFSRVRQLGYRSTCQSNLHQISLAMQQYVQDNNGRYPLIFDPTMGWWSDSIKVYVHNDAIFRCPIYGSPEDVRSYPYFGGGTSYFYNTWRLNDRLNFSTRHESSLPPSSQTWLNFCAMPDTSETHEGVDVSSSCGRTLHLPLPTDHLGGTNCSFLDGHVKWMTLSQLADLDCSNPHLGPEAG